MCHIVHYIRNIITRHQKFDYFSIVLLRKSPVEERVVSLLLDEYPQTHNKVTVTPFMPHLAKYKAILLKVSIDSPTVICSPNP
jgi:hypothetical protein